jgi:hypothetical protein
MTEQNPQNLQIKNLTVVDDSGLDDVPEIFNEADLTFCPPTPGFSMESKIFYNHSKEVNGEFSDTEATLNMPFMLSHNKVALAKAIQNCLQSQHADRKAEIIQLMTKQSKNWLNSKDISVQANPNRDALFKILIHKIPAAIVGQESDASSVDKALFYFALVLQIVMDTPKLYCKEDAKIPFNYSDMLVIYSKLRANMIQETQGLMSCFSDIIEAESIHEYESFDDSPAHNFLKNLLEDLHLELVQA